MVILKVSKAESNTYSKIQNSMSNKPEIEVCNNLDACGCTGNSQC